jgi:hypothetical protein
MTIQEELQVARQINLDKQIQDVYIKLNNLSLEMSGMSLLDIAYLNQHIEETKLELPK